DGLNTIRVSGAKSADGFEIPDDTSHYFMIDTSPGTSLSNGVATPLGDSSMHLEWDPSVGVNLLGYSIRRANALDGPYNLIASVAASVTETIDSGLSPNSTYYYQVLEYDSDFNSRQLTSPFLGTTDEAPTPTSTETWTPSPTSTQTPTSTLSSTPTETPTLSPSSMIVATDTPTFTQTPTPSQTQTPTPTSTSTATPTHTRDFDVGPSQTPDGQIDAHDLIQILQEGKSETTDWDVLFEFAQFWKRTR
ncbi:MAG: fibronectin type III domain-containing protein, partial [Candidatus Omnitrophica bacterium]|nr:fibronectin type III domain-containing protein [Candidatus Omnitrophota bacterium]